MKYYVIEIAEGDSQIKGKGIYEYDNEQLAVATFHSKLGVAMKSPLYTSDLLVVMDEQGSILRIERYVAPVLGDEVTE